MRISRWLPPGMKKRPSTGTSRPRDGCVSCMRPEQGEPITPRAARTGQNCQSNRVSFSSIELHADDFSDKRRPCSTFDLDGAFRGDAHPALDRFDGLDLLTQPDA